MEIIEEREDDLSGGSYQREDGVNEVEKVHTIAAQESRNVKRLKLLLFSVLTLSAVSVSLTAYFYINGSENRAFEKQFYEDSRKVLSALGLGLENTLSGLDGFAVSIVSQVRESNQTWPFVSVPNYAARAGRVRNKAQLLFLGMTTKVAVAERPQWEQFTAQQGRLWVDDALDVQERDPSYFGPVIRNYTTVDFIIMTGRNSEEGDVRTDPYLPSWHYYPVITSYPPYNLDLSNAIDRYHERVFEGSHALLSTPFLPPIGDWYKQFLTPDEDPLEPVSSVAYPINKNMADSMDSLGEKTASNIADDVPALLEAHIYWREWIRDILAGGSNGIVVVFQNECNVTFSYQLHGPKAQFLGMGDFHDRKYDYMEVSSSIHSLRNYFTKTRYYAGVPLDEEYCPTTVKVYASNTMKDSFVTSNAIIFAVCAGLIFIFTSLVFVAYDIWVERRQDLVMTKAVTSTAIVSSLFPETVRDRIFPQPSLNTQEAQFNIRSNSDGKTEEKLDAPIADLFPAATVYFADIAGFTQWSADRPPVDVFLLLETLYGAFDVIAMKCGVFKIETIGDCYVAVTGVPKAQPKHAVIMCKFAADCREKMNELTSELSTKLGPDTAELKLRIGLHSGPVTAGVLRGQKVRFQLFGDTVNTASRCESLGSPNRIHISDQTAKLIMDAGYGSWLTKRKDIIEAKGKGLMQTYWVEPRVGTNSCMSTTSRLSSDGHEYDYEDIDDPARAVVVPPCRDADYNNVIGDKLVNYLSKTTLKGKTTTSVDEDAMEAIKQHQKLSTVPLDEIEKKR